MKKITTLLFLLTISFANAQAFKGKGDIKFQVGANIQKWGTGITATSDFGLGENISYGFSATYLLNTKKYTTYGGYASEAAFLAANPTYDPAIDGAITPTTVKAKFEDRIDLRARFNANIGNVLNISDKLDVYPGLDLGLRNFGAHLGARYFFTEGFGMYSEAGFPLAKYGSSDGFKTLNNQFVFQIGATFNL